MADAINRPITDPREIDQLLDELPLALERSSFIEYLSGFPRRYLANTPRAEIVKHYLLRQSLGTQIVISSISRQADEWKLVVIARDRQHLFSRIAGSLSCFGADIVAAEAFANRSSLVLDTFLFADREGRFDQPNEKDRFQEFLEQVIEGKLDLEPLLTEKLRHASHGPFSVLNLQFEVDSELAMTRMALVAEDHFGLLYVVSRQISSAGCNVEMAYIQTRDGRALDEFYLTRSGRPLNTAEQQQLEEALRALPPEPREEGLESLETS